MANGRGNAATLGFFTVVEHEQQGLLGGYLVLNAAGRPLEFHCTAPVKANRAQEILYGPTLSSYLYGEQIGRALLEKAKTSPLLVCTDVSPALALQEFVSAPVVLVAEANAPGNDSADRLRVDGAHPLAAPHKLHWAGNQLLLVGPAAKQADTVQAGLESLPGTLDLNEPFERIRQALAEAQRGTR